MDSVSKGHRCRLSIPEPSILWYAQDELLKFHDQRDILLRANRQSGLTTAQECVVTSLGRHGPDLCAIDPQSQVVAFTNERVLVGILAHADQARSTAVYQFITITASPSIIEEN